MSDAIRLRISGRVQGVGYRAWAAALARSLGLVGWVRNRADGSVELLAAGTREALDLLEEKCRRGPAGAHVDRVESEPAAAEGEKFEIRRTD